MIVRYCSTKINIKSGKYVNYIYVKKRHSSNFTTTLLNGKIEGNIIRRINLTIRILELTCLLIPSNDF